MKKMKNRIALMLALSLALALTACGGDSGGDTNANSDTDTANGDASSMSAEELAGGWVDDNGNMLVIEPDDGSYGYRTYYGRVGRGDYHEDTGKPMVIYDGFNYDLLSQDGGLTLRQNGSSDRESLDGAHFGQGESNLYEWQISELDGIWQDALGETLIIDSSRMEYLAYSKDGMTSGTIADEIDGKGMYLFLNGRAYLCPSADRNSFTLFFEASETQSPDGTYEGVFYREADAATYADLSKAEFSENSSGHLTYYDGVNVFYLPDGYTVGDDGLAYDADGNVFGAGWEAEVYDPAQDWGENWAENWG